ncbi:polyprotein [Phytophthora megakarya]|uniref:Polyprotein n=1 Tax=Phytophthora megakarya TaxID=4795 RepID=A0A225VE15_9STRA|nr:polyprotein [Phytophthora megakarya]
MWTAFEQDKTKRDFANSIRIRRKLYGAKYVKGINMDKFLEELEDYRRQLENMNVIIHDAEMANIVLTAVEGTHRNFVQTFNRVENPPELNRVLNSLRSEAEIDKAEEEQKSTPNDDSKLIGAVRGKRSWKGKKQRRFGGSKKAQGGKQWKETRECHHCHKVGHLKANCKALITKTKSSEHDSDEDDNEATGTSRKTNLKQKKSKKIGFVGRWSKNPHIIGMMQSAYAENLQVLACTSDMATQEWMLDTGTDVHVCTTASSFLNGISEDNEYFDDWRGDRKNSDGIGLVRIRTENGLDSSGAIILLDLEDTRYSPNGPCNLISQERLELNGWIPTTPFTTSPHDRVTYFTSQRHEGIQIVFKKRRGHYWLTAEPVSSSTQISGVASKAKMDKLMMWHMRFAHQNVAAMKVMVQNEMVEGMESLTLRDFRGQFRCIACQRAKQKRMTYKRQEGKRQKECYARLMSDVCSIGILTPGGNLYFQLIQDEASRFKWCYLLKEKSDADENIMNLILQVEKDHVIHLFSSDRGGEFLNKNLTKFLADHGIKVLLTNSYTPEENCLVEKLNCTLMNKVRAIQEAAGLPECLWGEVIRYVVNVDNMSATKALNGMTPYEKLHGIKPQVSDLHVCGSVVFHHIPKKKRSSKLDMRADPGLFLGYSTTSLGYRVLDLCTGDLVERRDVVFYEDMTADPQYVQDLIDYKYFGKEINLPAHIDFVSLPVSRVHLPLQGQIVELEESKETEIEDPETMEDDEDEFYDTDEDMAEQFSDNDSGSSDDHSSRNEGSNNESDSGSCVVKQNDTSEVNGITSMPRIGGSTSTTGNGGSTSNPSISTSERQFRRSRRVRRPPIRFNPKSFLLSKSLIQCMMIATVCDLVNPTSVKEALASEHAAEWKRAMNAEYESLLENNTWELVQRPKSTKSKTVNILTSLWVLVVKRNEKGDIDRHKARLAIKGYKQKYGLDYLETYSPVVRIESVRLILLLALLLGLECRHVDFVTAFLNGVLTGVEIFMEQPEGYDDGSGRVCRLLRGLYGLKQASRVWNNTLHNHLITIGFKKCTFDAGVYWKVGVHNKIFLTVYVDDIVIAANAKDIAGVVAALGTKFKLKDLGRVKHLLGMEINYKPGEILCISQTAYIDRMLQRFGLATAKSVRSPQMQNEPTLPVEKKTKFINDADLPFREMVGSLQYLVHCTRPDLANVVRTLGRYGSAYTKQNFRQAQRVMKYLLGTKYLGLVYRFADIRNSGLYLDAFADADHAGCPETSKSVSGWVLRLNTNVWHWQSKKQGSIADDTCAAELIAAHKCTKELKWVQKMLGDLNTNLVKKATLFCDNQSTIKEIENNGNSQNQKHSKSKAFGQEDSLYCRMD